MDKHILIFAAIALIAAGCVTIPQGDSAVIAKFCSAQEPSVKVYACGAGVYEIASLPDVGVGFVDSNGTKLAQCNGFINKPNPPECETYLALNCDRTYNLCSPRAP